MRHPLTLAAVGLLALALAGCANATTPAAGPPAQSSAQGTTSVPAAVSDPGDVADSVARTFWATDTGTDQTPAGAAQRATAWLTPSYAAIATQLLPSGPGADFLELASHHGHTTVTFISGDTIVPGLPTDTATTATRVRILTLTPTGADGWIGTPQNVVATLMLTRVDDANPWLVNNITVDQAIAGAPQGPGQDAN
jgi:hypothetical protein